MCVCVCVCVCVCDTSVGQSARVCVDAPAHMHLTSDPSSRSLNLDARDWPRYQHVVGWRSPSFRFLFCFISGHFYLYVS